MKRQWFRVWYAGHLSNFAHSFAVYFQSKDDGIPLTACGVNPYTLFPDSSMLAFATTTEDEPRCEGCVEALREKEVKAA